MKVALLATVVYVAVAVALAEDSGSNEGDKQALLAYERTWGDDMRATSYYNWTENTNPCDDDWAGVVCGCADTTSSDCSESESRRVTALSMLGAAVGAQYINLSGSIPQEFGRLTSLRSLNLQYTNLTGSISSEVLQNMPRLKSLSVAHNRVEGSLPAALAELPLLTLVDLSYNNFSGEIPAVWCNFSTGAAYVLMTHNDRLCGIRDFGNSCNASGQSVTTLAWNTYAVGTVNFIADNVNPLACCNRTKPYCDINQGCGIMTFQYQPPGLLDFNFTNFTNVQLDASISYTYKPVVVPIYGQNVQLSGLELISGYYYNSTDVVRNTTHYNTNFTIRSRSNQIVSVTDGSFYDQVWTLSNAVISQNVEGEMFAIKIVASDNLCPSLQGTALSPNVKVVVRGPNTFPVSNTVALFKYTTTQTDTTSLSASWTNWIDPLGVPCCWYWVKVFDISNLDPLDVQRNPHLLSSAHNLTDFIYVGRLENVTSMTYTAHLDLTVGNVYVMIVAGANEVGYETNAIATCPDICDLITNRTAPYVEIVSEPANLGLILGLTLGIGIGIPLILGLLAMQAVRIKRLKKYHRELEQTRQRRAGLDRLLQGLSDKKRDGVAMGNSLDPFADCEEVAFVITDLENSTACAAADRKAYKDVQIWHDMIMREARIDHNGYEVCTEGDSFQMAFLTVVDAVRWAMEVQYRLLQFDWPDRVLKMPSCNAVFVNGERSFYGPRVRMGIHWATAGTFNAEEHPVTRTHIYPGPSWQLAQEVGDIGWGGQVLMTHYAWRKLRDHMSDAHFPVVTNMGLFKFDKWPEPFWMYEVHHLIHQPVERHFEPLNKAQPVLPGLGCRVVDPPLFNPSSDTDAKVMVKSYKKMGSSSDWVSSMMHLVHKKMDNVMVVVARIEKWVLHHDHDDTFPLWLLQKTYSVIASVAIQFRGYLVGQAFDDNAMVTLVFNDVHSALCCCESVQMKLLDTHWTPDKITTKSPLKFERTSDVPAVVGHTLVSDDGRLLFNGPRVAMAVHLAHDLEVSRTDEGQWYDDKQYWGEQVQYSGEELDYARAVNAAAWGGQVVVTSTAWRSLHEGSPWGCQVLSLGCHVVHAQHPPEELMEVLLIILQLRTFPPLQSLQRLSPGFRDSPNPNVPMAICFAKVGKPMIVVEALMVDESQSDDTLRGVLTTYFSSVILLEQVVRNLLPEFDGYECKNPEPGKFTLAFKDLEQAVLYNVAVQQELLHVPWPEELLEWDECRQQEDSAGRVIWRGLRLHAGITWGKPDSRKPLNTGRADYFGSIANMAARIMAAAQPGQVLLQGTSKTHSLGRPLPDSWQNGGGAGGERFIGEDINGEDTIVLKTLGYFQLKGFSAAQEVMSATPNILQGRVFPEPKLQSTTKPTFTREKVRQKLRKFGNGDADSSTVDDSSTRSGSWSSLGSATPASFSTAKKTRKPAPITVITGNTATLDSVGSSPLTDKLGLDTMDDGAKDPSNEGTAHSNRAMSRMTSRKVSQLTSDQISAAKQLAELYVTGRQASNSSQINKQGSELRQRGSKQTGSKSNLPELCQEGIEEEDEEAHLLEHDKHKDV